MWFRVKRLSKWLLLSVVVLVVVVGVLVLLLIRAKSKGSCCLICSAPPSAPPCVTCAFTPAEKQGLTAAARAFSPPHKARRRDARLRLDGASDQVPRAPARFVRRRHGIGDLPLAFRMQTKASEDGFSSIQHLPPTCVPV